MDQRLTRLEVRFVESPMRRTIPAEGFLGSKLDGVISLTVYSQHLRIPATTMWSRDPEGDVGTELTGAKIGESGDDTQAIDRVLECDLRMSRDVALALAEWLVKTAQ